MTARFERRGVLLQGWLPVGFSIPARWRPAERPSGKEPPDRGPTLAPFMGSLEMRYDSLSRSHLADAFAGVNHIGSRTVADFLELEPDDKVRGDASQRVGLILNNLGE